MNDKINISKGDIPETDAEVEKILAKKTTKKKLSLVTDVKPEAEKEVATPVQIIAPHTAIAWHGSMSGLDLYSHDSHSILDLADRCYTFYGITPVIQLWGEVICNGKPIRIKQEAAIYQDITTDTWHLTYSDIDVHPIDKTFVKARVGVTRENAFERWEETPERKAYRAKLLDSLRIS